MALATALKQSAKYLHRGAPETKKGGPRAALSLSNPAAAGLDYSLMVTTMPAPTVRPPSRMA
ncbi:hypothetical protein, partial [Mesorhizobium sp.]|uniref:hypothetical protein n=1 Tax=Mesorhizobium sp. TaxID=1871066 RepID=UPI0025BEB11A